MVHSVRAGLSLAIAGALLVGASAPVLARGPSNIGTTPDGDMIRYNPRTNQYCLSQNMTGSNFPKVTCRSRDEWAAAGLVIDRH
jgi:hypothetical protein